MGVHATPLQQAQFQERKNLFYCKVVSWQGVLVLYIPGVMVLRTTCHEDSEFMDNPNFSIDGIQLLLPSNIGERIPWNKHLGEYEWLLHEAQAHDSLDKIWQNLCL